MADCTYTNGVIAVRERLLLGEKLLRFPEMTAEEVLRALSESGFGGGETEGEEICKAEERALDAFIREYAPSKAEREYLLAPRDFHNAKALCKAERLGSEAGDMLAPEGMRPVSEIEAAIKGKDYASLGKVLGGAVREALETEELTGAEIGVLFEKALYAYLESACKYAPLLKKLLRVRAERTNLLTVMRVGSYEEAKPLFIGNLKKQKSLLALEKADLYEKNVLSGTPQGDFFALCQKAKERGLPFTEAERELESFEAQYFYEKRFELEGKAPFLYYVFRRRAEIGNVRITLVCLGAGLPAPEIRKRLRAV